MILYYALGGGLGHLTRARAVVETLGLADVTILTASNHATDRRVTGGLPILAVPPSLGGDREGWRDWLAALLARQTPTALYLDAFPLGILGEFAELPLPPDLQVVHLARRLRWADYRLHAPGPPPRLDRVYTLESLEDDHAQFLRANATTVEPLILRDPPATLTPAERVQLRALLDDGRPLWLIVHSGPDAETAELVAYADDLARLEGADPLLVVITGQRPRDLPDRVRHLDLYPATPLFPHAARLITAAGFNVIRQAVPYRDRHHCLPFPRRFDDQFARGAMARWRDRLSSTVNMTFDLKYCSTVVGGKG